MNNHPHAVLNLRKWPFHECSNTVRRQIALSHSLEHR